jgi:chromosome partitioning protein
MPSIVVMSSKGGTGKSTTSILLATEFASRGVKVHLYDCDPNQSTTRWWAATENHGKQLENVELVTDVTEKSIITLMNQHDQDGHLVIVDCPGTASRLVSRAIVKADLVLTPLKPNGLDAQIGREAADLIREEEEVVERKIPHYFVLTMTSGVRSIEHRQIVPSMKDDGERFVEQELMTRTPYSWLFTFGGDLNSLPEHKGKLKAIEESASFADCVEDLLVRAVVGDADVTLIENADAILVNEEKLMEPAE